MILGPLFMTMFLVALNRSGGPSTRRLSASWQSAPPQMVVELMTLGVSARQPSRDSRVAAETIYDTASLAQPIVVPSAADETPAEAAENSAETTASLAEEPTAQSAPLAVNAVDKAAPSETLAGYGRSLWARILAGQSGVLPVVAGAVLIATIFQSQKAQIPVARQSRQLARPGCRVHDHRHG